MANLFSFVSAGLRTGRAAFNARKFWATRPSAPRTVSDGVQTSISFSPRAQLDVRPPVEDHPAVTVQVSFEKSIGQKRGHDDLEPDWAPAEEDHHHHHPQQRQPKRPCLKKPGLEAKFGSELFGGRKAEAKERRVRFDLPPASPPKRKRGENDDPTGEAKKDREVKRLRLEKLNDDVAIARLKEKLVKSNKERDALRAELAEKGALLQPVPAADCTNDREASRPPAAGSIPAADIRSVTGEVGQSGVSAANGAGGEGVPSVTPVVALALYEGLKKQLEEERKKREEADRLLLGVMRETGWGNPR